MSPLRGQALHEAIAAPARDAGVGVEPELIERLIADAASEPGILPLLQETMVQLWDARMDQRLTLADYQALGGRRAERARSWSRANSPPPAIDGTAFVVARASPRPAGITVRA